MQIKHVIFDLDGTLIDSSDGVLSGYQYAFESLGIKPRFPLTADLIGPPLRESLIRLGGLAAGDYIVDELELAFKKYYDSAGYRQADVFPGIREMLARLAEISVLAYVATNKRSVPTELIIEHLSLSQFFAGIFCLDSLGSPEATKSDLLEQIVEKHSLPRKAVMYIGDRVEDGEAARKADIQFGRAFWGYDMRNMVADEIIEAGLSEASDVLSAL